MTSASLARPRLDWVVAAAVAALGAATVALNLVGNGNLLVALLPLLLALLLGLIWAMPLRASAVALLFLGATLEAPYESFAMYQFRTPWVVLGSALLGNLNLVTKVAAMKFSGFDLALLVLCAVYFGRRAAGSTIDTRGSVPVARPMLVAIALTSSALLFTLAHGLSQGGDFVNALWQVQKLLYMPLLFLLLHAALRGGRDFGALGKALIGAAVYRALLAVYISATVNDHGEKLAWCTTHADSVLFAGAAVLIVVLRSERVPEGSRPTTSLALAIILAGMVANNRRLVWVSLAEALVLVLLLTPWNGLKRAVVRAAIVSLPLFVLYLGAGWNSGSSVFRPVSKLRSILDSKTDSSSLWRDLENSNLVVNILDHPVLGVGFGHEYVEYQKLPDVASVYPQFRYIPHNSVLAQFAFAGAIGVAGIWAILTTTVFLAARAYRSAREPRDRVAAMMCIVFVLLFLTQVYGDIGVSQWLAPLTIGPSMLVAAKLAVETGAWPQRGWPGPAAQLAAADPVPDPGPPPDRSPEPPRTGRISAPRAPSRVSSPSGAGRRPA